MTNSNVARSKMPLWRWILLFIFGTIFFHLLYFFMNASGTLSNNFLLKESLIVLSSIFILSIYVGFIKLFEKRKVTELNLRKSATGMGIGFGIGLLLITLYVGIISLFGYYDIISVDFNLQNLSLVLCSTFFVAVGEEVIFRGVIFRMLDERFGLWIALLISSLLFGFGHIFGSNATILSSIFITIEAGVLLGVAYKYFNSLWMPIGIHWSWNFACGNIFGMPVSGTEEWYSVISSEVSGPDIISGGSYGPEASIILAVLGLSIAIFLLKDKIKPLLPL